MDFDHGSFKRSSPNRMISHKNVYNIYKLLYIIGIHMHFPKEKGFPVPLSLIASTSLIWMIVLTIVFYMEEKKREREWNGKKVHFVLHFKCECYTFEWRTFKTSHIGDPSFKNIHSIKSKQNKPKKKNREDSQ